MGHDVLFGLAWRRTWLVKRRTSYKLAKRGYAAKTLNERGRSTARNGGRGVACESVNIFPKPGLTAGLFPRRLSGRPRKGSGT
jgi:hypothetical protein